MTDLPKIARTLFVDGNMLGALCEEITGRRVRQLAQEGVFPKAKAGQYDAVVCVPAYWRWKFRSERKAQAELDPAQERARKDRALAEQTEMRNDLTRGSVVLIEDVQRLVVGEYGIVRSRVLSMPSCIASRVPEPVRAIVMAAAQEEAHAALEALSADGGRPSAGIRDEPAKADVIQTARRRPSCRKRNGG